MGGHFGFGLALLLLLSVHGAWAALPPSPTAQKLERVGDQITAVENEILKGDTRGATQQVARLRKLISLQREEIRLTEARVKELTVRIASIGGRKAELEQTMIKKRRATGERFKKLAMALEERGDTDANPSLDALWLGSAATEVEKSHFLARQALMGSQELVALRTDHDQVLALEREMTQERDAMEFSVQELREKEAVLVANEKLQRDVAARRKGSDREGFARFARLKELREGERDLKRRLTPMEAVEATTPLWADSLRGRLPLPVKGPIVSQYGRSYDAKTSLLTFQKGISIGAEAGTEVKAVAKGRVAYAGELKHYGQMVIVEHQGQMFSIYGHLGESRVKEGQDIAQGQALGRASPDGAPVYFELRSRNIAVNPAQWLEGMAARTSATHESLIVSAQGGVP